MDARATRNVKRATGWAEAPVVLQFRGLEHADAAVASAEALENVV